MKFAREIDIHIIPEWSTYYIDYRRLKRILHYLTRKKSANPGLASPLYSPTMSYKDFHIAVLEEAEKINSFYTKKFTQLKQDLDSITFFFMSLKRETSLNSVEIKALISANDYDDSENRATSMHRTFQELNIHIVWLKLYCEVNSIALSRIIKKCPDEKTQLYIDNLEFNKWPGQIEDFKKSIYQVFAYECFDGDISQAKKSLTQSKKINNSDLFSLSFCCAFILILSSWCTYMLTNSSIPQIYPSLYFFRFGLIISLICSLISISIYYMDSYHIDWSLLLDISPSVHISYIHIFRFSLEIFTVCLTFFTFHISTIFYFQLPYSNLIPGIYILVLFGVLVLPYKAYRSGRYFFILSFFRGFLPFLKQIRFNTYILACWGTSLIVPYKDLCECVHYYLGGIWDSTGNSEMNPDVLLIVSCFPFVLRTLQDVRRVYDNKSLVSRLMMNLSRNGLTVFLIISAYWELIEGYFIYAYVFVTSFLVLFDLFFDWQIKFSLNLASQGRKLPKKFFVFAICSNLFLRFAGVASFLPRSTLRNELIDPQILVTFLVMLEIGRKMIWTVIRIDREKGDTKDKFRKIQFSLETE